MGEVFGCLVARSLSTSSCLLGIKDSTLAEAGEHGAEMPWSLARFALFPHSAQHEHPMFLLPPSPLLGWWASVSITVAGTAWGPQGRAEQVPD